MSFHRIGTWLSCLGLLATASAAEAIPGPGGVDPPTLREEAALAEFIVVGTFQNAREGPGDGSTDFAVTRVLKCAPLLVDAKVLTTPRHRPGLEDQKYLVFGEVFKGQPDFYRGIVATPALVGYLRGLLAIDAEDHVGLMRYCFDYLDHAEQDIATDALREFARSPETDIRKAARTLPAEKLRRWLQAAQVPDGAAYRLNLYGRLLGLCGAPEDAALLRRLLDRDKEARCRDGLWTGYVLLAPKDGWACLKAALADRETDFTVRYAGLRTMRYFQTTHPGVVTEQQALDAIAPLLEQGDIADLPIEDLRQWRCWKLTETILRLYDGEVGKVPIVRRTIVRYAMQCPEAEAACFVMKLRKTDPELIQRIEELLKLEAASPPPQR
jgi:hypothetical protein